MSRSVLLVVAMVSLGACFEPLHMEWCPRDYTEGDSGQASACRWDFCRRNPGDLRCGDAGAPDAAGGDDAGSDGGRSDADTDCASSSHCIGRAATPVCDTLTGACVECTAASQALCAASGEVCRDEGHECVGCNTNDDCTEGAPHCGGDNECGACVNDSECAKYGKVCDAGQCVECTVATEQTQCPDLDPTPGDQGPACDPVALTCTGERRGSLGTCGRPVTSGDTRIVRCVSDSECSMGHRCVPTTFKGADYGNYCLLVAQNDSCSAPWPRQLSATSVGGLDGKYCFPRALLATCEAVVEFGSSCVVDDDCGREGISDGHCEGGRCTYGCSGDSDCNGTTCTGFASGQFCNPF